MKISPQINEQRINLFTNHILNYEFLEFSP